MPNATHLRRTNIPETTPISTAAKQEERTPPVSATLPQTDFAPSSTAKRAAIRSLESQLAFIKCAKISSVGTELHLQCQRASRTPRWADVPVSSMIHAAKREIHTFGFHLGDGNLEGDCMLFKIVDSAAGDGMMAPLPSTAVVCVRVACENMHRFAGRAEIPRLRGERDEAQKQVARLQASRDDLARQQGHCKGLNAKVLRGQGIAHSGLPAAVLHNHPAPCSANYEDPTPLPCLWPCVQPPMMHALGTVPAPCGGQSLMPIRWHTKLVYMLCVQLEGALNAANRRAEAQADELHQLKVCVSPGPAPQPPSAYTIPGSLHSMATCGCSTRCAAAGMDTAGRPWSECHDRIWRANPKAKNAGVLASAGSLRGAGAAARGGAGAPGAAGGSGAPGAASHQALRS